VSECAARSLARAERHRSTAWVVSFCHLGFLHYFLQRIGPTEGAYEGTYSVEAVTRSPIPTSGERASWGPRGMAQCVWLLTFEQPSDLPPVYMRFGPAEERNACDAMGIEGLQTFCLTKYVRRHFQLPSTLHIILLNP
jgi:hypothetical protein